MPATSRCITLPIAALSAITVAIIWSLASSTAAYGAATAVVSSAAAQASSDTSEPSSPPSEPAPTTASPTSESPEPSTPSTPPPSGTSPTPDELMPSSSSSTSSEIRPADSTEQQVLVGQEAQDALPQTGIPVVAVAGTGVILVVAGVCLTALTRRRSIMTDNGEGDHHDR